MASPAIPPAPSGGGNSSWAPQSGPVRSSWSRGGGESGVAFRGLSRGRPGGRGGRGRSGRGGGGRGGAVTRTEDNKSKPSPEQAKEKSACDTSKATTPSASALPPTPASTVPPPPASKANGRTKAPAKKASESRPARKTSTTSSISTLVPSSTDPSPTSTRPVPRRRRSHTNTKAVAPVLPSKQSLSAEPSLNPILPEPSISLPKDVPPHLAPPPTFDIKHDIDALVERVRAIAMDRPFTPGSHIDWAGDDDDSLPDLDDWGVTSTAVTDGTSDSKASIISPILEDALKPLPSLDLGTPIIVTSDGHLLDDPPPHTMPEELPFTAKVTKENALHAPVALSNGKPKARRGSRTSDSPRTRGDGGIPKDEDVKAGISAATSSSSEPAGLSPTAILQPPLHPSLPPKPVNTLDVPSKHHPRNGQAEPAHSRPKPISVGAPAENGLSRSIHAPPNTAVTPNHAVSRTTPTSEEASVRDPSSERGLEASMHAPLPPSLSAPSHISTYPHSDPPSFNPAHSRSRTLGRPPGHLSDSDRLGLARGDGASHARTRSTPPTGSGPSAVHARAVHATRPVITGDAISRLARTLGHHGIAVKRDAAAVSASKD